RGRRSCPAYRHYEPEAPAVPETRLVAATGVAMILDSSAVMAAVERPRSTTVVAVAKVAVRRIVAVVVVVWLAKLPKSWSSAAVLVRGAPLIAHDPAGSRVRVC